MGKQVSFEEVECGKKFKLGSGIKFLKLEREYAADSKNVNAVCLETGCLCFFHSGELVKPCFF